MDNVFTAPFDNALVPGGFNGSIPWSGLPVPINVNAPIDVSVPIRVDVPIAIYVSIDKQSTTPVRSPGGR
jgi:hypothetical protein